jgi:hypothetical protein
VALRRTDDCEGIECGRSVRVPVSDDDLAHLLRRTEFVVRPERLAYLKTLPSIVEVVDDVINISLNGSPA